MVRNAMLTLFTKRQSEIKKELLRYAAEGVACSFTNDGWTSCGRESHVGVTVFTIAHSFRVHAFRIAVDESPGSHTTTAKCEYVGSKLGIYGFGLDNVAGFTFDNTTNLHKSMDTASGTQLRCIFHSPSLVGKAMQDAAWFMEASNIINETSAKLMSSPQHLNKLASTQKGRQRQASDFAATAA